MKNLLFNEEGWAGRRGQRGFSLLLQIIVGEILSFSRQYASMLANVSLSANDVDASPAGRCGRARKVPISSSRF